MWKESLASCFDVIVALHEAHVDEIEAVVLTLSMQGCVFHRNIAGIEGRSGRERPCFEFDLRGVGSAVSKLKH